MKFIITGPESSGKTFLTNHLAKTFQYEAIDEFARKYIGDLDRPYTEDDVLVIGQHQIKQYREDHMLYDTDLLTSYIWIEVKFHKCNMDWLSILSSQEDTYYLLCKPDIPYEADPLREHPHERDKIFDLYLHYLQLLSKPYAIIEGDFPSRIQLAENCVRKQLKLDSKPLS